MLRLYGIDRARRASIRRERMRWVGLVIGVGCWLAAALLAVSALVWGC